MIELNIYYLEDKETRLVPMGHDDSGHTLCLQINR